LSALSADLGTVTAGIITNPSGTAMINLNASGFQAALRFGAGQDVYATLLIQANGTMRIGAAPGGEGQCSAITLSNGQVRLNNVTLSAPSGTLGQLRIASGGHIQSSDYVPGTSGWQLGQTDAELNNVTLRGTLAAPSGTLGQLQIASGGHIQSSNYS